MYHYPRLPDQITVLHGPHERLARFFLVADDAARAQGVRLRLHTDFERLMDLNRRHRESWPPLTPIFDPAHSALPTDAAFWIEGVDAKGDAVVTHAARLFDWPDSDLAEEVRSLRVFYRDPAPHRAAGEAVAITAPSATRIRGRNAAVGALWVRPDHRRSGIAAVVPRIVRAFAHTRWDTAWSWSFVEPAIHARGLTRNNGPFLVEEGVMLRLAFRGDLPALLVSMTTDGLIADVGRIVDQAMTESSRTIERLSRKRSPPLRRQGMRSRS